MVCAIQRSNSQWYSEDEKNTNYVLNLEKRNCKQATKSPLRTNDKKIYIHGRRALKQM